MNRHGQNAQVLRYGPQETVFREGDPGATMYVVHSGTVRLYREHPDQGATEIGTLQRGEFFGEGAVLEGVPRSCSAQAVEAAELVEIDAASFDKMIRNNMEIAVRLMRKLSQRAREAELGLGSGKTPQPIPPRAAPAAPPQAASSRPARLAGPRGEEYPLSGDECTIGRFDPLSGERPTVDLSTADRKRSVSRRHALLRRSAGAWELCEEAGVVNGTFVNDERLASGERRVLRDGDTIRVATIALCFHG